MIPNKSKSLLLSIGVVCGLSGCSKKEEAVEAAPAAAAEAPAAQPKPGMEVLPGASSVRTAMTQKDYTRAVGALMALQPAVVTEEQRIEYGSLLGEVRTTLEENKADPKASQALMQLYAMRSGR